MVEPVELGGIASCTRCHNRLIAPKKDALNRTMALSISSTIAMATVLSFPFLKMSTAGLSHEASVIQIVTSLAHGWYMLLAVAVVLFVIAIPMIRSATLIFVMWSLQQKTVSPHIRSVFLVSERLAPWAMTEIFMIGTGVALIKVIGLATVSFGPAFWLFFALVVIIGFKNASVCRWTVWSIIRERENDQSK